MWVAFALQKLLTFFQQKISTYTRITLNFNESLTNDIVSFEQLGPEFLKMKYWFIRICFKPNKKNCKRNTTLEQ